MVHEDGVGAANGTDVETQRPSGGVPEVCRVTAYLANSPPPPEREEYAKELLFTVRVLHPR